MKTASGRARVLDAIAILESNRAQAREALVAGAAPAPGGRPGTFPRSRTFRWLVGHPLGRWVGSAVVTGALARLPLGRLLVPGLLRGKSW